MSATRDSDTSESAARLEEWMRILRSVITAAHSSIVGPTPNQFSRCFTRPGNTSWGKSPSLGSAAGMSSVCSCSSRNPPLTAPGLGIGSLQHTATTQASARGPAPCSACRQA
jgi:hypothetical protein